MARGGRLTISRLYCSTCGQPRDIPRPERRLREVGHIKSMFCATCQRKRPFVENRSRPSHD
jgi:hypothetical protein